MICAVGVADRNDPDSAHHLLAPQQIKFKLKLCSLFSQFMLLL